MGYTDEVQKIIKSIEPVQVGECQVCGIDTTWDDGAYPVACPDCTDSLPASLIKADCDPFDYVLGLRTGVVIHFHKARISGEWVTLYTDRRMCDVPGTVQTLPYPFERGIDVRISDIVWCADAPFGS